MSSLRSSPVRRRDELFFCVTFSDTRAVFGATSGSILLGRVPSTRRRVHWVRPWPPSNSNNHRCIVGRRFVRSDVLATQSRAVFPESRVTFAGRRRRRKLNIADSDGPSPWRRGWSRGRGRSICDDVLCRDGGDCVNDSVGRSVALLAIVR